MNKKLVIINGPMGVGKSSVCRELNKRLDHSVWLDGDWCWMMNPFTVNEENKEMVQKNITYLLKNFLLNSSFEYIIFSWVIPDEKIFDLLLEQLDGLNFDCYKITLLCSKESLLKRIENDIEADIRNRESVPKSIEYLTLYDNMRTEKIDTTNISTIETVNKMIGLIQ